jgi:hypothetical protein
MKPILKSLFFIGLALGATFWVLYVLDMTSYERLGKTHVLGQAQIDIDRSRRDVYELMSGLQFKAQIDDEESELEEVASVQKGPKNLSRGVGNLLGLPALKRVGSATLLMVDHRQPDFIMYQERLGGIIFIHGIGLEEVEVGTTTISWEIQSPNTQWWFHGCILHLALFFWEQEMPEALKKSKKILEKS